jgi:glucose 1-dehydrogenase
VEQLPDSIGCASQWGHYCHAGLAEMLTKNTAMGVADKGIRVNGIAPGAIATDMNKDLLEDEGRRKEKEQTIPLRRIGNPEEIAKVALFLASSDASYITGTTIYGMVPITFYSSLKFTYFWDIGNSRN